MYKRLCDCKYRYSNDPMNLCMPLICRTSEKLAGRAVQVHLPHEALSERQPAESPLAADRLPRQARDSRYGGSPLLPCCFPSFSPSPCLRCRSMDKLNNYCESVIAY